MIENLKLFQTFEESSQKELNQVGGKGFNLVYLRQHGFEELVPDGFFVSTDIFMEFLSTKIESEMDDVENGESEKMESVVIKLLENIQVEEASPDDILAVSSAISDLLLKYWKKSTLLIALERSISKRIDSSEFYSVRSSGVDEDMAESSFAGQMETFLNVEGADSAGIVEKIVQCWCSAFSPRALTYRKVNGFGIQSIPYMCVIVQKMVKNVKSAGVLFTAHPISSRRDLMLINCSFGLGEAVVSGLVNCDLFEVEKPKDVESGEFRISFKNIASKGVEIVCVDGGNTKEKVIEQKQQTEPCIAEKIVLNLARIGFLIEKSYNGVPQDIEFAIDGDNRIFILQSRPITNLQPLPRPFVGYHEGEKLEEYHRLMDKFPKRVFLNMNNLQVVTKPWSPMGATFLREVVIPFIFSESGIIAPQEPFSDSSLTRVVESRGRMYIDVTDVVAHPHLGNGFSKAVSNADMFVSKSLLELIQRNYLKDNGVPVLSSTNFLRTFWKGVKNLPGLFLWKPIFSSAEDAKDNYLKSYDECMTESKKALQVKDSGSEVERIEKYVKLFSGMLPNLIYRIVPSMGSIRFLDGVLKEKPDLLKRLLSGIFLNSKLLELSIHEISLVLKKFPKLLAKVVDEKEFLSALNTSEVLETLLKWEEFEGVIEFVDSIREFLREYGSRGVGEIDIFQPRFRENLAFVINAAISNVDVEKESKEDLIADSMKAEAEILDYVQNSGKSSFFNIVTLGLRNKFRIKIVRNWLQWIRHVFQLRETHKHLAMVIFDEFRLLCVDIAHRVLIPNKILDEVKDVYFLYYGELIHILKKNIEKIEEEGEINTIRELIKIRKEQFENDSEKYAAKVLTDQCEDVEVVVRRQMTKDLPEGVMIGEGVSSGQVTGPVKVILDPKSDTVPKGHILVSKMIDPSFSALFKNCSGIISSVGGQLTHGSVVAREMGIPAVVGVFDCSNLLKDGDIVKMDGSAGTVEKCQNQNHSPEGTEIEIF